jgi:hypothetical protein
MSAGSGRHGWARSLTAGVCVFVVRAWGLDSTRQPTVDAAANDCNHSCNSKHQPPRAAPAAPRATSRGASRRRRTTAARYCTGCRTRFRPLSGNRRGTCPSISRCSWSGPPGSSTACTCSRTARRAARGGGSRGVSAERGRGRRRAGARHRIRAIRRPIGCCADCCCRTRLMNPAAPVFRPGRRPQTLTVNAPHSPRPSAAAC